MMGLSGFFQETSIHRPLPQKRSPLPGLLMLHGKGVSPLDLNKVYFSGGGPFTQILYDLEAILIMGHQAEAHVGNSPMLNLSPDKNVAENRSRKACAHLSSGGRCVFEWESQRDSSVGRRW